MGMFSITQPDILANKNKNFIMSCNVLKESDGSVKFLWAQFPIEMRGVSMIVPSPSGSKLLVIRNPENEADPSCFEIWSSSCLEKEFLIPQSMHGSVYNDGWLVMRLIYIFAIPVFLNYPVLNCQQLNYPILLHGFFNTNA